MAHAEGKLVDWAAGDAADLLNCSHLLAGMERLQSPQEWEPAYRYLEHLQQTGGDSGFVRVTRDTVLDDIIHSREALTQATTPESLAQLDADEGLIILAEAAKTMPLLDTAYNRVREIFGV